MVFSTLTIEVVGDLQIASGVSEGFPMVGGFTDCLCHGSPTAVDLHKAVVLCAVAVGLTNHPLLASRLAPHNAGSPFDG